MVVNVQYITNIREITKKRGETIELKENATLHDLLDKLMEIYGVKLRKIILSQLFDKVSVLMASSGSGGGFKPVGKFDLRLHEGATILIGTVVEGG